MATHQMIAFLLLALSFITEASSSTIVNPSSQCYTSLFSFGDSATAAGIYTKDLAPGTESPHCAFTPYGETYFHRPTGRCSDGRNIVDFLAQHLGLPLLPPYHGEYPSANSTSFLQGANFAVVSATVLDFEFLKGRGIVSCQNCSLSVQLARFKTLLGTLCSTPLECREYLKSSLILLGEIGGVDYMRAAFENLDSGGDVVEELMPIVVGRIGSAIEEMIKLGAVHFLVPGDFCHDLTLDRAALALNSVRALGSLSLNSLESKEQEQRQRKWENSLVCITLKNDGMSTNEGDGSLYRPLHIQGINTPS